MSLAAVPRVQQRIWLADQLSTSPAGYLVPVFLRVRGVLDVGALRRALAEVVTRHEILRTSLSTSDGVVVGVLRPPCEIRLDEQDAGHEPLADQLRAEAATPLDIATGPPLRAVLLRCNDDDHVLSLVFHHAAFDQASEAIFLDELSACYNAFRAGGSPALPPVAAQFCDVALAAETQDDTATSRQSLLDHLADLTPFELPADRSRPAERQGGGATIDAFALSETASAGLARIGRAQGASLFMVLLAATAAVLHRYTGHTDVVVGTSSTTRDDVVSENLIGPFLNLLVLRHDLGGDPAFSDLVRGVRETALDVYDRRAVGFDELVEHLGASSDRSRTPLFQILVDLDAEPAPARLDGLEVTRIQLPQTGSKYDLSIAYRREAESVRCELTWDTALYEPNTMRRLATHLSRVLTAAAERPDIRLSELPLTDADEERRLRRLAEPDPVEFPDRCLHELFTEQAERTPDAVAVRDELTALTYAELDERSTTVAGALRARGAAPDVPIGVVGERCADLVVVLLGILKAGGAYVPIDPDTPPARVGELLAESKAPVCVIGSDETVRDAVLGAGCLPVTVADLVADQSPAPLMPVSPDNLCAVYYTSGSTGRPKGVACTHRGWVNRMVWMQHHFELRPREAVLHKTTLSFDDAAVELFWPLAVGGQVAVLAPGLHRDPREIIDAAVRFGVVHLQFVPSVLELFLDALTDEDVVAMPALRSVLSSGEALRPALVARFLTTFGTTTRLTNTWGATEVSIDSTWHTCGQEDTSGDAAVSLGRPMDNNGVHVLDSRLQLVPQGGAGELCISGTGLARGYLGDPGRTALAFVPHPWKQGERIYRTGDRGRLASDGSARYLGRTDRQVKIRGVRLELDEVEAAVLAFPAVADCAVTTWEPSTGDRRLVAYVVFSAGGPHDGERDRLRAHLAARLAPAAVPSAIIAIPGLPRLASGKIDRRALPVPDLNTLRDNSYIAPATPTEEVVARIWAEVLGIERAGADDDFFALGGHSLLVTRAVNRMREAFATAVPLSLPFTARTVRATAAAVEELIVQEIEAMTDEEARRIAAEAE